MRCEKKKRTLGRAEREVLMELAGIPNRNHRNIAIALVDQSKRVIAWLRKLSWILVGGVIGANVGFKLFVAQQLEVAHHFIERFAFRSTGGFEPPSTFGATKTLKTLSLNPYQIPAHGCLYRANEYQRAVIGIKDRSLHNPILMGLSGILHK